MLYSRYDTYCVCGFTLPVCLSGGVADILDILLQTELNWTGTGTDIRYIAFATALSEIKKKHFEKVNMCKCTLLIDI